MRTKYYIVALNYNQYQDWLASTRPLELLGENDYCNAHFSFVDSVNKLRGLSEIKGFYLPGCESRPDYQEIKTYIKVIKSKAYKPVYTPVYLGSNNNTITGREITGIIIDELSDVQDATWNDPLSSARSMLQRAMDELLDDSGGS